MSLYIEMAVRSCRPIPLQTQRAGKVSRFSLVPMCVCFTLENRLGLYLTNLGRTWGGRANRLGLYLYEFGENVGGKAERERYRGKGALQIVVRLVEFLIFKKKPFKAFYKVVEI